MIDLKTTSILADESGVIWFTTDIKAPSYWWDSFEHKVLKVIGDTCFNLSMVPIMKTIEERDFKMSDFSHESLGVTALNNLENTIKYWYAIMQSLPSGYNSCGKFRYSLTSAAIMIRALKPKILENGCEFKEFVDFFKYLDEIIKDFSL